MSKSMDISQMDSKPILDVEDLRYCAEHSREWKRRIKRIELSQKTKVSRILYKWRKRQAASLGYKSEDPDPYNPSYVFFCLEGVREK